MIPATYSLIRYVPDPARNEPANVGLVLWVEGHALIHVEPDSVRRIINVNPQLDRHALDGLSDFIQAEVLQDAASHQEFVALMQQRATTGLSITSPTQTSVVDVSEEEMRITLNRLNARLVRPRIRSSEEPAEPGPLGFFLLRFDSLIDRRVITRNYEMRSARSNTTRTIDFYANSGTNVAFDVMNINLKDKGRISERIDAQAGKVYDLRDASQISTYFVFCHGGADEQAIERLELAQSIIGASGAKVRTNRIEAAEELMQTVGFTREAQAV